MDKLTIVSSGPGDEALLPGRAYQAFAAASRILGTERISSIDPRIEAYSLEGITKQLKAPIGGDKVVLVSGDAGFHSFAKSLIDEFAESYEIDVIPGIGSLAYFSARIQVPYDDALLLSMHGRNENIVSKAAYNQKIFALTGGENRASSICSHLDRFGLGDLTVTVGENLSYPDERITSGLASDMKWNDFSELSVMYIANPNAVDPHQMLTDDMFIRGDVPMTKAEIRWLSIDKLGISPGDIVFDIGAGTGSVAIEMARRAHDGLAYAIEQNPVACELILENLKQLSAFNLEVIKGVAPAAFSLLPAPDKAFIGGSSGNLELILRRLLLMNPKIRVVANAITLQTVLEAINLFEKLGFGDVDLVCVSVAKAQKAGKHDMMIAQNPIYIISGTAGSKAVEPGDEPGEG